MQTVKGTVLCMFGISLTIISVACGDSIAGSATGAQMLMWAFVSFAFLATGLLLCALGVSSEVERMEEQNRKINRVAHRANEWRNVR